MTERLDQQITQLRKSGKLGKAYKLAKKSLEAEPDNFYLRNAMAWILYEKIKRSGESLKDGIESTNQVDLGDVSTIEVALDEYRELSMPVPDLSLSLILSRLVKPVGRYISSFMALLIDVTSRSNEVYRDEDNEPYHHAHGASASLQTKVARESAAWCQHAATQDANFMALAIKLLCEANENPEETPQNRIWINYDLSKLYFQLNDKDNAIEYAKKTVRQKKDEWWAWHWLGRLYFGIDNTKSIACMCEAIECPHDEDKIGKLRLDLAALLKHSGDIAGAVTECLIVEETYETRGWKFPGKLDNAMNSDWFDSSLARENNLEIYEKFALEAIEITYQRVEEFPASFLRKVKSRESGRNLVVFATKTGSESFQQVLPARVADQMELDTGDPVFLRVAVDGDHEYTLRCKPREGESFDGLSVRDGLVVNHSRDGSKAGVYLSEREETVIQGLDAKDSSDFSIGGGVRVWVSLNQKNQHLECFCSEPTSSVPKLDGLESFGGVLRGTDRGFGFVEDTFVPAGVMDPLLVGNLVKGLKVRSFDKSKDQLGWKAISLEALAD